MLVYEKISPQICSSFLGQLFKYFLSVKNGQKQALVHSHQFPPYNQVNPTTFDKGRTLPREEREISR